MSRACNRLKVDDHVVAKHLAFGHNVEVVAVSVFVGAINLRAPLLVAVVRAKVGNHDNNAVTSNTTCATGAAWRFSSRGQVVALATSSSTPGRIVGIEQRLRPSGSVDVGCNTELFRRGILLLLQTSPHRELTNETDVIRLPAMSQGQSCYRSRRHPPGHRSSAA